MGAVMALTGEDLKRGLMAASLKRTNWIMIMFQGSVAIH